VNMPGQLVANAVASSADGAIYATVMLHPQNGMADIWKGAVTGAVYKWTPKAPVFQRLAGTELTADNGIEVSRDGRALYVNSIDGVTKFTNANPAVRLTSVKFKNRIVDNLHWVGRRLIVAGTKTRPCPRSPAPCPAGYYVDQLDPQTLSPKTIAEGGANMRFSITSVGLLVGNTLWLGSPSSNALAYRSLSSGTR
jgi:hypothetical protein